MKAQTFKSKEKRHDSLDHTVVTPYDFTFDPKNGKSHWSTEDVQ